jgi:hypothetical protein
MSAPSCPHFDSCSAPLCPADSASLQHCAWFTDEEVCRRHDHSDDLMVRAQRKLAGVKNFSRGCFTAAMLSHTCEFGRRTEGLDPDVGEISHARVEKWIADHPPAKPQSAARLEISRKALERARAVKKMAATGTEDAAGGSAQVSFPGSDAETVPIAGRAQV